MRPAPPGPAPRSLHPSSACYGPRGCSRTAPSSTASAPAHDSRRGNRRSDPSAPRGGRAAYCRAPAAPGKRLRRDPPRSVSAPHSAPRSGETRARVPPSSGAPAGENRAAARAVLGAAATSHGPLRVPASLVWPPTRHTARSRHPAAPSPASAVPRRRHRPGSVRARKSRPTSRRRRCGARKT